MANDNQSGRPTHRADLHAVAAEEAPEAVPTAGPVEEGDVPVAAHVRRAPGTAPRTTADRIADLDAELLRVQLAIVQTGGDMTGAHLNAARDHVQRVLDEVVEGKRKLTAELAEFLAKPLKA